MSSLLQRRFEDLLNYSGCERGIGRGRGRGVRVRVGVGVSARFSHLQEMGGGGGGGGLVSGSEEVGWVGG